MSIGRGLVRLVVGGAFVGHGTQKLFGWFGGSGLEATATNFEQLGLRPGRANAIAAGTAETAGGALLALGFATPLAASLLVGTMLTAIERVHLKNGPWVTRGGYEYNAVLIATVLALTEAGPGVPSVDAALGRVRSGAAWAAAVLGTGAAAAAVVRVLAARASDQAAGPSTADAASSAA